jgi:hypothetical protein
MLMLYSTKRVTVKKKMRRATIILSERRQLYSKALVQPGVILMENGISRDRNPQFGRLAKWLSMPVYGALSEENVSFFRTSHAFAGLPTQLDGILQLYSC